MAKAHKPISDQVIVITGASSGIGLATAISAAEAGARLVLNARSADVLQTLTDEINKTDGNAISVIADVAERSEVQRIADAALQRFGRIDTWVNNAGVSIYGKLKEIDESDSRRLFETNFWGVVNGSLVALPCLEKSHGTLINVGSEVSEAVVPLQGMYSASKHAVKGFTDALRVELLADQSPVTVTLIQPGSTNTPFPQHARNYMDQEPALPTPMDDPYDVAEEILEASSDHKRAVKVGPTSKLNVAVSKIAPGLGDRIAAKQVDRQHYNEPPRQPEGTLYEPGHEGEVYGSGGRRR